ncbi:hypothetical protein P171DRAFT_428157 [Karstenula rhodostoma CBS 690.94]|uniref:F-box domain-containing protein n=1 Tax=Karstenula rhodostoma CBS 690.94 TaxID=1392251 RepID=A0A9P4UI95_9PLEO|nr:hypothetical protein P171DRAFT_428157 [Karstenula rhodostoma CBS 690.94]
MAPASPPSGPSSFHAGDPAIPMFTSGIYCDGRKPKSWSALPNEIQLQILAPIAKVTWAVSVTSQPRASKDLLPLLLVNKRMSSQALYLYQQNQFVLIHGVYSPNRFTCILRPHLRNNVLKHPNARFCRDITALNIWFFPESICAMNMLDGSCSWAALFRYQTGLRLGRSNDPLTAALEETGARRIAWQVSFTSLRRFEFHVDFQETTNLALLRNGTDEGHVSGAYCDPKRGAFIQQLSLMETAFPNIEEVAVSVLGVVCPGHTGTWSRKNGFQKIQYIWDWNCSSECAQKMGEALEAALLRRKEA